MLKELYPASLAQIYHDSEVINQYPIVALFLFLSESPDVCISLLKSSQAVIPATSLFSFKSNRCHGINKGTVSLATVLAWVN
ncbi:hypothetical protein BC939DRAFT_452162 [Gamsiella multidivaricata]|uniref:uncharacterized protein n=1 Tax=Gamsiella multidivaricata TaxID=101098 RepID=UPI00221F340A|nr:uncharacterized protein BC939DRAFT_452162 [Gamsiella multidivaricata]KAI7823219.1 hypothetical protein BC939DRAFT_452162 [Gamsiella multidivaricata]